MRRGLAASLLALMLFVGDPVGFNSAIASSPQKTKISKTKVSKTKVSKTKIVMSAEEIKKAEQLLSDLGYWTGPIDGKFDVGSRHALIAFQKVEKRKRTGRLTPEELQAIRTAQRPAPIEAGYAHIEVDLEKQVLFMIDAAGKASHILPVSTGNDKEFDEGGMSGIAYTPRGAFKVYHKIKGWRKSPLGLLYYPNYITGGIAVHGNPAVPIYPASHGCIRIPMFAAKEFSELTPIGTVVVVHEGILLAKKY